MGIFNRDETPGSGGGISGRIIVAVLIALFGLFTYFTHTQENPVTHEKQHISLTPNEEIRLGLESAPSMVAEMGGEVSVNDPRAQEVSKIGEFIVSKTEAVTSPWKFKFHLLADKNTINAFALPGGQVFITLGLLNKLQTEAQLAGVLSHEMGHVIERHSAQQMAKSRLGELLVVGVGIGASGDQQSSNLYNPMVIASVVNQMIQLRYSRHDESQADLWGLKLMEEVGFDPRAMIEVMNILKASGGAGHKIELFETHPNPDLRIQQINAYLEQHPPGISSLKEGKNLKDIFKEIEE
ncbi:MAG: M48 family metallopeptidase [Parachlamydiaceae bacterium]|nr:M48 family metallopeptidase [Parachlamydiaceae bacterium]